MKRWNTRQCRSVQSIIGAVENLQSKPFISFIFMLPIDSISYWTGWKFSSQMIAVTFYDFIGTNRRSFGRLLRPSAYDGLRNVTTPSLQKLFFHFVPGKQFAALSASSRDSTKAVRLDETNIAMASRRGSSPPSAHASRSARRRSILTMRGKWWR